MDARHDRLRRARIAAGYERAIDAAERFGWNRNTYKSNENGAAPFGFAKAREYAEAFKVRAEWLYDGQGAMVDDDLVEVVGRVGANPDGAIAFATGDAPREWVPAPPGADARSARALRVVGVSMTGMADDGSIIYFQDQRSPVTEDMIGQMVVVETDDDQVLIKRLLRGTGPGLYHLQSVLGPTLMDVRIRWAAHLTAIVPPYAARQMLVRHRFVA